MRSTGCSPGKQIPGALKALADRWNDGSDPYAQGAFQGKVVGYIATQVAIIVVSSITMPIVGPYADVITTLKLVSSPVEGIVEVAAAARASRGVASIARAEEAVGEVAVGGQTAARGEGVAGQLAPGERQFGGVTGVNEHSFKQPAHASQAESPRTVRIYAAGQAPKTAPWRTNAGGVVRSPDEALAIARAHGVVVPDDMQFFFKDPKVLKLDADTYAVYFARDLAPGSTLRWTDLLNRFDNVAVRVSSEVLSSDEAIVAVIAHEMHELNNLRRLFEESGGAMSGERFARLVNRGIKGNLHDHAWDVADELVRQMRAADGVTP